MDSLRAAAAVVDDDDDDDDEEEEQAREITGRAEQSDVGSPSRGQEVEEDEEQDARGVKEDFSELTKTLTRQFWGVASFLAPAPAPASLELDDASDRTAGGLRDDDTSDSPRIAGIRSDFAEISGKFRSGISSVLSHTKTVSEISKIASSILPFGVEEEGEEDEDLLDAVGINEEVLAFARNVSIHPETWLDFPLPHGEEDSKGTLFPPL